jgi:hypothetical protein
MLETQRSNPWKIGFLILGIAVVLWIGYAITVPHLAMKWSTAADFGNMFGGIGALFSGLALAGVVVAVLMQREELELQREELRLTRAELKRQAAAQEISSRAVETQVQLMLTAAKLNANSSLLAFYSRQVRIPEFMERETHHADNIYNLLKEMNLMSTQQDPPAGSQ